MSFGNRPCMQSVAAAQAVQQLGKPFPPELSKCNTWFNPLGCEPGRGWVILQRRDLDSLDLNAIHDWIWEYQDQENTPRRPLQRRELHGLVVSREPLNLTPSNVANDKDSIFLVELADARWRVQNVYFSQAITRYYNVRAGAWQGATGATEFMTGSLNGGTTIWTWQTMFSDAWSIMAAQLGTAPTLPFTPDGNPEGFIFLGTAWDAVTQILARIGCAVRADHSKAQGLQFTVVRVGVPDPTSDQVIALAEADHAKIHDAEWIPVSRGRIPGIVQVSFHRKEKYPGIEETTPRDATQWLTQSVYSVSVPGTDPKCETGVTHQIWDDLPAIYDTAGLTNSAALNTRAAERAADFYRLLESTGGTRLTKRYTGLLALTPGSTIKGVAYREDPIHEAGVFTEVIRHPFLNVRVADGGYWQDLAEESTKLRAPDFRPTFPVYPQPVQWLYVSNGTPTGIYYTATVERYDHAAPGFVSREAVFAIDPNGATTLTVGWYMGRLVDFTTKPVYAIVISGGGGGLDFNSFRNLYKSWYGMPVTGQSIGDTTPPPPDTIAAVFFPSPRSVTLTKLGIFVAFAGVTGAKLRLGIYDIDSPENFDPRFLVVDGGDLLVDEATLGSNPVNVFAYNTINFTTNPDTGYWLVLRGNDLSDDTGPALTVNWVSNVMEYAILGRLDDGRAAFWYLATLDPTENPYGALPATAADWLLGSGASLVAKGESGPDIVVRG